MTTISQIVNPRFAFGRLTKKEKKRGARLSRKQVFKLWRSVKC